MVWNEIKQNKIILKCTDRQTDRQTDILVYINSYKIFYILYD